ncbi:unnamed protein product [Moneuplotes crassus]|uniref:Uncharacterized protein n=1 Tax=Euplotes crassus TaxID=5936 RepID=A0AAD1Y1T7_EUPCR|nr:unnamed protein product [Moneuplotes crassus]
MCTCLSLQLNIVNLRRPEDYRPDLHGIDKGSGISTKIGPKPTLSRTRNRKYIVIFEKYGAACKK